MITRFLKLSLTTAVVLLAAVVLLFKYQDYLVNPWTRDGQVRAEVVQVAARVSGPIVELPLKDNQQVKAGDLLFAIDPRTYAAALAQAQAQYDKALYTYQAQEKQVEAAAAQVDVSRASLLQAGSAIKQADATVAKNKADYQRQQQLLPKRATSQKSVDRAKANYSVAVEQRKGAVAALTQAKASLVQVEADLAETKANLGASGDQNASIRDARAALEQAELNLEFTRVKASVDGYVTNLNLRLGSQAVANQPMLALIDTASFWVHGFFRETSVSGIRSGDRATVTLMSYPDQPVEGRVDSLGWGIAQQDGSPGVYLLPNVNPTFAWIRLAQRVPVRVHLDKLPDGVQLRVGTTASVLVRASGREAGDSLGERLAGYLRWW